VAVYPVPKRLSGSESGARGDGGRGGWMKVGGSLVMALREPVKKQGWVKGSEKGSGDEEKGGSGPCANE